jgi:DNA polymerase/3'-5' exonuclease PolX
VSTAIKRPRAQVLPVAKELLRLLAPSCERLEFAGSLRRETKEVGDIELVGIPKIDERITENPGFLFNPNAELSQKIKVNLLWEQLDVVAGRSYIKHGDKYRQFVRRVPGGEPIKVDVFTATPENWGLIMVIRTGPWEFSRYVMTQLNRSGYKSDEGAVYVAYRDEATGKLTPRGDPIPTPTEEDVFELARIHPREAVKRF